MAFHETRMGHEFFLKTVPEMVKQQEKIAKTLEDLTKSVNRIGEALDNKKNADEKGTFEWSDFEIEEKELEKAKDMISEEDRSFFVYIINEIENDPDGKPVLLIDDYARASKEERKIIDAVFVNLTGWSLATLIRKYTEKNT